MNAILYRIIDKGILISCLLTLSLFPFGLIARFPLVIMVGLLFISLLFKEFRVPKSTRSLQETTYFALQVAYYVSVILSCFWSANTKVAINDLEIKISILLIPIVFYFGGVSLYARKNKIAVFYFIMLSVFSIHKLGIIFSELYNQSHTLYWFSFNRERFLDFCIPNLLHHSYISLYLLLGIFIGVETIINRKKANQGGIINLGLGFGVLSLLIYMFIINSRAGIVAFIVAVPVYFYIRFPKPRGIILLLCGVFLLISGYLFTNNSRVKQVNVKIENASVQSIDPEKSDPRTGIWISSWECIVDNVWIGVGTGDLHETLNSKYTEKAKENSYYNFLLKSNYNCHNQFLETWLGTGILGLILLIATLVVPVFMKRYKHFGLLTVFLIIVGVNMLFESLYNNFGGTGFIPLIISFIMYDTNKNG